MQTFASLAMPDLQATEKGRLETKHKVHASEIEAVEGRLAERVQEVEELRRKLQVCGQAGAVRGSLHRDVNCHSCFLWASLTQKLLSPWWCHPRPVWPRPHPRG